MNILQYKNKYTSHIYSSHFAYGKKGGAILFGVYFLISDTALQVKYL